MTAESQGRPLPSRGWRPDAIRVTTTGLVLALLAAAALVPAVGGLARATGFWLVEVVGRLIDRPTWLLVATYGVVGLAALGLELRRASLPRAALPSWLLLCCLALLGQGYLLAFAFALHPAWLMVAVLAGLVGGLAARGRPRSPLLPAAPIVTLFVVLHLLVEGAAGHVLTPWLHAVSATLAGWSRHAPLLYWPVAAVLALAPAALAGHALGRLGLPPVDWLHPDPRRLVDALAVPSLAALTVVAGHYATAVWSCPPADAPGMRLVSPAAGAFDLAVTEGGRYLVASLREPQELLVVDLETGDEQRLGTGLPEDGVFDRTEPEILLALPNGRVLVLLASSDSEQGNHLALLDPSNLRLSEPLPARGVSDLVGDGAGGVWVSTEFTGLLARLDLETGNPEVELRLDGRAETNKIVVEAASGRAWSTGLWFDDELRMVDLRAGHEMQAVELGTHQWDMALSPRHRLLFVPKLVDGYVAVWDADTLEERWGLPARFGVRPVEVAEQGELVVTGNLYTGEVVARSIPNGQEVFRRRIGGQLKALHAAPGGIYAGSNCGIFQITR
jgi:hypothetical protein